MVKELREATGLGIMGVEESVVGNRWRHEGRCRSAQNQERCEASKAAGRTAAEGVVSAWIAADGKVGALVEVNCETDFVSRNEDFLDFSRKLAGLVGKQDPADLAAVSNLELDGATVESARQALVQKIGENISVRRFARFGTGDTLAYYLHGTRIGVLVDYAGGDEQLGKDIAMHIAASKPLSVSKDEIPGELLAKEREIYSAQAAESGKPANIVEKMVEGRIVEYFGEVTLLGQPFVKDQDLTIEKLLASKRARVNRFTLFVVGEGIEKKSADFAQEVLAAAAMK